MTLKILRKELKKRTPFAPFLEGQILKDDHPKCPIFVHKCGP
jgi:hypothetical protein